ncbi:MAG: type II toxin-antitoxin system VapC family toxin [Gammaproteobacteria bacterium]|nr:type II toxin-antitoxin system VapC family toxin [Gammaproteobacteria bacterium]MDE0660515.1 type II toxin-antitoxin system VapC family toxin [Gammaproteobacteria bacterium]MXY57912.1 type II toxin-antitoxin system VapC family toxin [Gammaproteobacteria bacterium]MYF28883.1 type II toxin-antitoxin system VapC family toxin [Gammaproteobacteria bacterium]MYK48073.1 type II toxin-antitoxin system VapC family toxin [Gammaproteobacteria bacterium]
MTTVFDSSALLAIAFGENGADVAAQALDGAVISAVNAAEVVTRYVDRGSSPDQARRWFEDFGLAVRPFDEVLAMQTGSLREKTREHGLSLGDRACLSLAMRENASVVTADRAWASLDLGLDVQLIR